MAAREKSIFRISLLSDGTTCACEDAHRASVDVLFFSDKRAQFRANWNPPQNSEANVGCVARAREKNALVCHLCFRGRTQTRGSLASSELAED